MGAVAGRVGVARVLWCRPWVHFFFENESTFAKVSISNSLAVFSWPRILFKILSKLKAVDLQYVKQNDGTCHCPTPHPSLLSTAYGANVAKLLSTPITYSQQAQFSQAG